MEEYIEWLENRIEICSEDKDLQREHWAFCQSLTKMRELLFLQPDVIGSLQVGYWFLDEYSNEVTMLHIFNEWCIVEDDFNDEPYILPLEFIQTIKNESDEAERFLSNDR